VDLERRVRLRQLLKRHVHVPGVDVVEHRMTMAEGAALDVFAGEPDADPVREDRGQRELLGQGPVHGAFRRIVQCRVALLAHALELAMHREVGRQREQRRVERLQLVERHARLGARGRTWRRRFRLRLDEVLFRLEGIERGLQRFLVLAVQRFG
jgi:hypothetical protein